MKIQIDINDDADLRKEVKNMVRDAAVSVAREEFGEIIRETLKTKIGALSKSLIEQVLKETIKSMAREAMGHHYYQDTVKEEVASHVKKRKAQIDEFYATAKEAVVEHLQKKYGVPNLKELLK